MILKSDHIFIWLKFITDENLSFFKAINIQINKLNRNKKKLKPKIHLSIRLITSTVLNSPSAANFWLENSRLNDALILIIQLFIALYFTSSYLLLHS